MARNKYEMPMDSGAGIDNRIEDLAGISICDKSCTCVDVSNEQLMISTSVTSAACIDYFL